MSERQTCVLYYMFNNHRCTCSLKTRVSPSSRMSELSVCVRTGHTNTHTVHKFDRHIKNTRCRRHPTYTHHHQHQSICCGPFSRNRGSHGTRNVLISAFRFVSFFYSDFWTPRIRQSFWAQRRYVHVCDCLSSSTLHVEGADDREQINTKKKDAKTWNMVVMHILAEVFVVVVVVAAIAKGLTWFWRGTVSMGVYILDWGASD